MDILNIQGITKNYAKHRALTAIDLSVPHQCIFGLLGPNGAGKTTLIRIINQIINADEGHILIENEPLRPSHIETIGYLPEERGLYKKMKVGEQLLYLARLKGLTASEAKQRILAWMEKFEIRDWWSKKLEDLSKGMAQKVQFISTVVHEPRLIILDEPFSGFDPVNANLIKNEILELRDKGATIIFSTHRMESVEELCDRIALINKSRKIVDGSKNEIKRKYRTNTYKVSHHGKMVDLNTSFSIIDQQPLNDDSNSYKSMVKINGDHSPNELLKALIDKTEVSAFVEDVPSMNDIFIEIVKNQSDE